jgi:hypothetical protein
VSLLAVKGRTWEADLYRLAANRRALTHAPPRVVLASASGD